MKDNEELKQPEFSETPEPQPNAPEMPEAIPGQEPIAEAAPLTEEAVPDDPFAAEDTAQAVPASEEATDERSGEAAEEASDDPFAEEEETEEATDMAAFTDDEVDSMLGEVLAPPKKRKLPLRKIAAEIGSVLKMVFPLVILLSAVGLVLYYIWLPSRNEFHSDCTDTLWWAEAAMQGNGMVNPDFSYAAIMPFGGNLCFQLWIPFFGISMMTQCLGMTTYFAALLIGLLWLAHELHWKFSWSCFGISVLLMTISASSKIREIFWGHIIYYSLGVLLLVIGLALVIHLFNLQAKEQAKAKGFREGIWLVLLLAMFVVCCTNSTTAIALFALPIVAAVFCERFLDHSRKFRDRKNLLAIAVLLICGIGVVAGMKWGEWLCGDVTAGYASAYSGFSETGTWWEHVENLPLAFLNLLGLNIDMTQKLMSLCGINMIVLIAFWAIIMILPVVALCNYKKIEDSGTKMLLWAHFTLAAFVLIGYICGLLNSANWRLSPVIFTGTLASIGFMGWMFRQASAKRISVLLLLPMLYFAGQSAWSIYQMPPYAYKENIHYELAEYLESQNLTYGYATFWNSNVLTVVSDSKCKVRSVDVTADLGVAPYIYQSNSHWFEEQPDQKDYFLLMNMAEYDTFLNSQSPLRDKPHAELEFKDYHIWVFDENLF